MDKVKVLIVDDHQMVREGLRRLLQIRKYNLHVVGVAASGEETLELVGKAHPDVVLMDMRMPGMNGVQAIQALRESYPAIKCIVLTAFEDDQNGVEAIHAGAFGYMLKDAPAQEIAEAIYSVHNGNTLLSGRIAQLLRKQLGETEQKSELKTEVHQQLTTPSTDLAPREREILRLIIEGKDNWEIAQLLHLTEGTVKNYVSRIYTHLGVRDRAHAIVFALKHNLFT